MQRLKRFPRATLVPSLVLGLALLAGSAARAEIPATYKGKPFDTVAAGGPKLPATVKSGPYTIPGRLDFINYDMGGDGVGFHAGDHIMKGGAGYRIDGTTATLSWTGQCIPNVGNAPCMNVWYDTSATLDGTVYPTPTTTDFTIGAVQVGDYFNFTVNVTTAGTYALSSTWASGAGDPGGEGGDGTMGLDVFSNGTKLGTWSAIFPNFNQTADFHHWKAYPSFAMVTLAAGPQVIKLQSKTKHLQLDYVQFDLVGADGGVTPTDAGPPTDGGAAGTAGTAGTSGAAGTTGTAGTSGAGGATGAAGGGASGAAGDGAGTAGSGAAGTAGSGATGAAGTGGGTAGKGGTSSGKSGGCSLAASSASGAAGSFLAVAAMALGLVGRSRRRARRR